jgi:hypothetical protein
LNISNAFFLMIIYRKGREDSTEERRGESITLVYLD